REGRTEQFLAAFTNSENTILSAQHDNLVLQHAFQRKMASMRTELGWDGASALERLLIERVVLCWNHLTTTEQKQAFKRKEGISLETAVYLDAAVDRAERRYLRAIQTLATLRRVELPAMQINVLAAQVPSLHPPLPVYPGEMSPTGEGTPHSG